MEENNSLTQLSEKLMDETLQFKKALIDERIRQGITQEDMAKFMGISVKQVQEFEEYYSDPHLSDFRWYAGFLGVSFTINIHKNLIIENNSRT